MKLREWWADRTVTGLVGLLLAWAYVLWKATR